LRVNGRFTGVSYDGVEDRFMTQVATSLPVFPAPLPERQPGRASAEEIASRGNLLKPMGAPLASMEAHFVPVLPPAAPVEAWPDAQPAVAVGQAMPAMPAQPSVTTGKDPPKRGQNLDVRA
jgi:hypothetical protein